MHSSLWIKPGQCNHHFVIQSFKLLNLAPTVGAPNDYAFIIRLGCEKGSYSIPSHALHKVGMASEYSDKGVGGSLPPMDGVVKVVPTRRVSSSDHPSSTYFKQWTNNQSY
jgi:hypothetical protein